VTFEISLILSILCLAVIFLVTERMPMEVTAITRLNRSLLAPGPQERLHPGDILIVKGRQEKLEELRQWETLITQIEAVSLKDLFSKDVEFTEVALTQASPLKGKTLSQTDFRNRFEAMVLAIGRDSAIRRANLQDDVLQEGDRP
jgi:Trk K+ transport system NAD-binding subunit